MAGRQAEYQDQDDRIEFPFREKLRSLVFGDDDPDSYTKATFYTLLIIWSVFFIWSIASYFAISMDELLFEHKKIPIRLIIEARGKELGFETGDFLERLATFHAISIISWLAVFAGLVLIWRKDMRFIYFFFGGTLFYFGMILFYLGITYYRQDTTLFDKIAFLFLNALAVMYYFLLRKEQNGGSLSFFGEDEEDEE